MRDGSPARNVRLVPPGRGSISIIVLFAVFLAFIPNIGPIIAAVPAIVLAFSDGPTRA